jgi:hypothetical protein
MNQIKLTGELSNDVSRETTGNEGAIAGNETEIRTLRDLELVLASGGDGLVIW